MTHAARAVSIVLMALVPAGGPAVTIELAHDTERERATRTTLEQASPRTT
jgi:hypothetical protein